MCGNQIAVVHLFGRTKAPWWLVKVSRRCLAPDLASVLAEYFGPRELQELELSFWDTSLSPLRNRWRLDIANPRRLGRTAEGVNNLVCCQFSVHT